MYSCLFLSVIINYMWSELTQLLTPCSLLGGGLPIPSSRFGQCPYAIIVAFPNPSANRKQAPGILLKIKFVEEQVKIFETRPGHYL